MQYSLPVRRFGRLLDYQVVSPTFEPEEGLRDEEQGASGSGITDEASSSAEVISSEDTELVRTRGSGTLQSPTSNQR